MVKPVDFRQARNYFRTARVDLVRAGIKRPILLAIGAVAVGAPIALVPALVPALALSALLEGTRYAINRFKRQKDPAAEEFLLAGLIDTLKKFKAPDIAAELLASSGRGEKLLAREVLSRLRTTAVVKYDQVARRLETSYKGRKLLGMPFKLISPALRLREKASTSFAGPLSRYGAMAAIPVADQLLKLNPESFNLPYTLDSNVSGAPEHTIMTAIILAGYKLAGKRPLTQTGLSLIAWGAFSNLCDKLHLPGVVNYFHVGNWWYDFNLADASAAVGATLLALGLLRDK